jgi:hypothetical protein
MRSAINVEQIILGTENPDVALRRGVARAGETVENIRRARVSSVVLQGGGWPGGDGVRLQLRRSVRL